MHVSIIVYIKKVKSVDVLVRLPMFNESKTQPLNCSRGRLGLENKTLDFLELTQN